MFLKLTKNVIVLGLASFFTDVSSEMILALLPLFYLTIGAGGTAVGLIEGIAESVASLLKVYSGKYSDKIGKRKIFISSGYTFSTIAKVLFFFVTNWPQMLIARFVERIGKGTRASPRDALIADSSDSAVYGRSFGFTRMMDTAGAILGVILALFLVTYFTYRQIFLISVIPAAISVFIVVLFVEEKAAQPKKEMPSLSSNLDTKYKYFLVAVGVFALANFSYAFLVLRAKDFGASDRTVIMLYLLYNVVYTLAALPVGELSDKISRKGIITLGYVTFSVVCLGFAFASTVAFAATMFALYGIYQAIIEGVQKAYVADLVKEDVRGTAYGIFHTLIGLAALPASFIAGLLWQYFSHGAAFLYGAGMSLLATTLLIILVR